MLLFCYRNLPIEDIPGICTECMAERMTSINMFLGRIINIIQIVLVLSMCIVLNDFKKGKDNYSFPILSGMTMILSGINLLLFLWLGAYGHGEMGVEMIELDAQFTSARVISAILIFLNIILLIFVKLWYYEEKKSYNG